jgi:hypothetical protein
MPTSIAIILAIAGAILVVVGAIGGGFTFAAASIPQVGMLPRVISFVVGAVLITSSIYVFNKENDKKSDSASPPIVIQPASANTGQVTIYNEQAPPTPDSTAGNHQPVSASVTAPSGYTVNLYWGLDSSAPIVASLPDNYPVEIICTAQGASVTRPDGVTSSLWNGVSVGNGVGGFVPDVYTMTGTEQPVMPNCAT